MFDSPCLPLTSGSAHASAKPLVVHHRGMMHHWHAPTGTHEAAQATPHAAAYAPVPQAAASNYVSGCAVTPAKLKALTLPAAAMTPASTAKAMAGAVLVGGKATAALGGVGLLGLGGIAGAGLASVGRSSAQRHANRIFARGRGRRQRRTDGRFLARSPE